MRKIYTAHSIREMANKERFKCSFVTWTLNGGIILDCTSDVRAMLRQAADALEREERSEKKYEYAVKWLDENSVANNMGKRRELAEFIVRDVGASKAQLVRRSVGEWEEVK